MLLYQNHFIGELRSEVQELERGALPNWLTYMELQSAK
jgi:hypothetical protein